MKNTTGLYKHQRDNAGKRRKLPVVAPRATLVPVKKYEYEIARDADQEMFGPDADYLDNAGIDNVGSK